MIELRHFRYFVAVAEELHFSKAALRLNMSQPPLSQQIKALETQMGAELFRRTNRSVTLTQAGRDLYERVLPWLDSLEEMSERVRRISKGEEGQLSMACTYSTSQYRLPQIVSAFRDRYPNITVRISEMTGDRQIDALARGLIDLGIVRLPVDKSNLLTAPLYDELLMVALPPKHRLARRKALSLLDLRDEVFLRASRNSATLFESVERLCRRAGFEAKVMDVSSNLNTAVGLVGVGLGIALVPESQRRTGPRNLAYKPLRNAPSSTVAAVWRRNDDSSVIKLFVDVATTVAAQSQDRLSRP